MLPIASPIKYPFSPPYNSIVDMLDILKVAKLILLIDCRFKSNTKIFPFKVPIKISLLFLDYKKVASYGNIICFIIVYLSRS